MVPTTMTRMGAQMRRQDDDDPPHAGQPTKDWNVAVAIALSIVICLAAFVWIFVELDPFLDDFTGSNVTVTADPSASPVDETSPIQPTPSP